AALYRLGHQAGPPALEALARHDTVLDREQSEQQHIDDEARDRRTRDARIDGLRDDQVSDEADGIKKADEKQRVSADPVKDRDWSVADLAAVAGLSGRTLQRQFRSFLGQSPHAALRDIRFDCARRELLRASPEARVMDVALRWGFTHFGRFSIEYRRRYGETP